MNSTTRLRVELGRRSYPIVIGDGLLVDIATFFNELFSDNRHAALVFDANLAPLAERISDRLAEARRVTAIQVPSGETSKSIPQLERIWSELLAAHADRSSVVVAIGGGVVGDLAGFAASSFARGIPLVQIPTTLLSQVDSSVGGKTGINLPGAKNIVGAFWQPRLVLIDVETLDTLPKREFVSGLAEVAKYGVILLPELFAYLEHNAGRILSRQAESLRKMIADSCRAKAQVVEDDERETSGRRAALNYGHTFAHAIETTAGYGRWLHGEAVAIGMNMAAHLSLLLGRVDADFVARQANLLKQLQLPVSLPSAEGEALWNAMQHDKKVQHGTLRFILPQGELGCVELVSGIAKEQVLAAIESAVES